jgi:hypothetical protein
VSTKNFRKGDTVKTKTVREKADERKRIADDIRERFGGAGAICAADARRYLGLQREAGAKFLQGVPSFLSGPDGQGGKRMYLVINLAKKIYERQGS